MNYVRLQGTPYQIGVALGKYSETAIKYRLQKYRITTTMVDKSRHELEVVDALCRKGYPESIEQIKGIAEGSNIDYWKILLLNCPEILKVKGGCSSIAVVGKETILYHNEDGDSWERKKDFFMAKISQGRSSYTSFVYPGELPGIAYNWNSSGLYFSMNYVVPIRKDIKKVPRYFTCNSLLRATTISEAVKILKEDNEASGSHFYIGKGEKIVSVETANDKLSIKPVSGLDYHTNHYRHARFRGKAKVWQNSAIRERRINELLAVGKKPLSVLFDRKNTPCQIFATDKCENKTLSTVVFHPLRNRVIVYDGNKIKYRLDLA